MLLVIHALYEPEALSQHLAHYRGAQGLPRRVSIVMSGPLVDDDGSTMIGSLFLIEAPGHSGGRVSGVRDGQAGLPLRPWNPL
jgi:uncharacterized protein YciI